MATSRSTDIRAFLGGGANEDRVAAAHFLVGALFLVLGGLIELLALFAWRFAGLSPLSLGRLEPMANLALMIGFLVISLVGGVFYVLPRLTGAPLRSVALARLGLWLTVLLVVAGLGAIAMGFGDGSQPLGLPWWLDVPLLLALSLPAVNTLGTIARREEKRTYVTLWFVLGGVVWLPLLFAAHLAGTLPFDSSLTQTYSGLFFSAGFVTMWVFTVGSGLFYYSLVKEADVALASRQLAVAGFWSLGFAAVWWGVAQLVFGPGPGWVDAVAAALGLAFPIGALANASNVSLTLQGQWDRIADRPGLISGVVGTFFGVVVAVMASLASFRAVGSVTALTSFWEAVEYACLLGVGPVAGRRCQLRCLAPGHRTCHAVDRSGSFVPETDRGRRGRGAGHDGSRRDRHRLLVAGGIQQRRLHRRGRRLGCRCLGSRPVASGRVRLCHRRLSRPGGICVGSDRHRHLGSGRPPGSPGLRDRR